jgi:hypothetical protein
MPLTRDQALAALGLSATPEADAAAIQRAFERLARRYPQPSFPERFRQLLEARDQILEAGRSWRELLESSTLDLTWILPHLAPTPPASAAERRTSLQNMLRAGYLAERLPSGAPEDFAEDDPGDMPFP